MVLSYYGLREQPFGVTPDPRFLYASPTHREALSAVLYGLESGLGFVMLTAKPGMGKTTLLTEALRRMEKTAKTVFLFQTVSTPAELLRAILLDLGIESAKDSLIDLQAQLNQVLVNLSAAGKRLVVAIDEAQNLDDSVLEAVRMLSNFETARTKLMQIVLSGQLQLADKLAQPNLLQLRQRISIFAYMEPLPVTETAAYIERRLRIAGWESERPLFTSAAVASIARQSCGVPRQINTICFSALSLGYALQRKAIDADIVQEALGDLDLERIAKSAADAMKSEEDDASPRQPFLTRFRPSLSGLRAVFAAGAACAAIWLLARPIAESSLRLGHDVATLLRAPVVASAAPAAPSTPPAQSKAMREVQVRPGQSLFAICAEEFGNCPPELFSRILRINSGISDLDHIYAGQAVKLPVLSSDSP
jgi:general secretion pathway protein A